MARPRRGVDGRLTLLALLIVLVPQAASLLHTDLSTYLPHFVTADPLRYLLATMGLLYAVSLALVVLEAMILADRVHARTRWLYGLDIILRLVQGVLGAFIGIIGSLVVIMLSGISGDLQQASLWLATLLLALIVVLPFFNDRLGKRARSPIIAPIAATPSIDEQGDTLQQQEAQQEDPLLYEAQVSSVAQQDAIGQEDAQQQEVAQQVAQEDEAQQEDTPLEEAPVSVVAEQEDSQQPEDTQEDEAQRQDAQQDDAPPQEVAQVSSIAASAALGEVVTVDISTLDSTGVDSSISVADDVSSLSAADDDFNINVAIDPAPSVTVDPVPSVADDSGPSLAVDDASTSDVETLPAPSTSIGRGRRTAVQVVLLGAFGLDLLLYSLVVPFLPGEAQRLGATPLTTGILFAMYAAGIIAATPLAAWLTDRIGPRPTLLWGLIALGSSTLLFAYSPSLSLGLPGLFGARAAQGVASTLTWTAGFAILAQLHTAEERRRIFARAFTITGLSALIGPPLGGALYSLGGFMLPFLVATGLVVLDGLGRLLFLPGNALLPAMNPDRGTTRMLLRAPGFRIGLFGALAGALALSSLEPGTPLLLGQAFGMPVWAIGVIFGALALCFVIMQPTVSRSERRLGTRLTLALGLLLAALCFVGIAKAASAPSGWLGLPPDLPLPLISVVALLGVVGCALALVIIPVPELLTRSGQQLAGSHGVAYGAIYAAYDAAYAIGLLLGPVATGAAVATQGIAQSFLPLAILPALCALVLLAWRIRAK